MLVEFHWFLIVADHQMTSHLSVQAVVQPRPRGSPRGIQDELFVVATPRTALGTRLVVVVLLGYITTVVTAVNSF